VAASMVRSRLSRWAARRWAVARGVRIEGSGLGWVVEAEWEVCLGVMVMIFGSEVVVWRFVSLWGRDDCLVLLRGMLRCCGVLMLLCGVI